MGWREDKVSAPVTSANMLEIVDVAGNTVVGWGYDAWGKAITLKGMDKAVRFDTRLNYPRSFDGNLKLKPMQLQGSSGIVIRVKPPQQLRGSMQYEASTCSENF